MNAIISINPFPIVTEYPPEMELNRSEVASAVAILKPEYPWVAVEDIIRPNNTANDYINLLYSQGLDHPKHQNEISRAILKSGTPITEAERIIFDEFRSIPHLYLPIHSYVFAVNKFCEYEGKKPQDLSPKERESIFVDKFNKISDQEMRITTRRWELESDLFGEPISQEPKPIIIFSPLSRSAGRAINSTRGFLNILNLDRLDSYFANNNSERDQETVLSEILAHERKHYIAPEYRKKAKGFKFEEIFTELTSILIPKESLDEIVKFESFYSRGAFYFLRIIQDLSQYIPKNEILKSVFMTAITRDLYGEKYFGKNNQQIKGFGTLYKELTNDEFSNRFVNWDDEEIRGMMMSLLPNWARQ